MLEFEKINMIESDDKSNEKILFKLDKSFTDLILSEEEIIYFNNGKDTKVNKTGVLSKTSFDSLLLDYNKKYIEIYTTIDGYGLRQLLIQKEKDEIKYITDSLIKNHREDTIFDTKTLTQKEVEKMFNPTNYDIFIIFSTLPTYDYIYSKTDGKVKGKYVIPNKKQMINKDYHNQSFNKQMASIFGNDDYEKPKKKKIEEIKDLYLYCPAVFKTGLGHILITIRNKKISVMYFNLKYVEMNKYELKHSKIKVEDLYPDNLNELTEETTSIEKVKTYSISNK